MAFYFFIILLLLIFLLIKLTKIERTTRERCEEMERNTALQEARINALLKKLAPLLDSNSFQEIVDSLRRQQPAPENPSRVMPPAFQAPSAAPPLESQPPLIAATPPAADQPPAA